MVPLECLTMTIISLRLPEASWLPDRTLQHFAILACWPIGTDGSNSLPSCSEASCRSNR